MKAKKYAPKVNRQLAMKLAHLAMHANTLQEIGSFMLSVAKSLPADNSKRSWKYFLTKYGTILESGIIPDTRIFQEGNAKLPFVSFSTLPVVTCPGAGDCISFCYSLKAWRYPTAFFTQFLNTLRLRFAKRAIIKAFQELPESITLRLYVDGDFDSIQTAIFWFNLLSQRPDVACYGYSKSWEVLLAVRGRIPGNYVLNLSSGSRYNSDLLSLVSSLPCVRGQFVAVPVEGRYAKGFARYSDKAYHNEVRESAQRIGLGKVFSCPGSCGDCGSGRHMCGRSEFSLPIAIGVH